MSMMAVDELLADYRDGDERGWDAEFALLRATRSVELFILRASIERDGIREPIHLGPDGRVWDGHHRLCVAVDLGITDVPVRT